MVGHYSRRVRQDEEVGAAEAPTQHKYIRCLIPLFIDISLYAFIFIFLFFFHTIVVVVVVADETQKI